MDDDFEPITPDPEPFTPIEPDAEPEQATDEAGPNGYGETPDRTEASDG